MTTRLAPTCLSCLHLRDYPAGAALGTRRPCQAFPDGIPAAIWLDGFDHRQPFDGDGGVRFEQDPDRPPPLDPP